MPADIFYPADVGGGSVPAAGPACRRFPVIVFGHGYQTDSGHYGYLVQHYVPRGFIVALCDTANELVWNFSDFGADMGFLSEAIQAEGALSGSLLLGKLVIAAPSWGIAWAVVQR